jgi:hypothetical protein
LEDGQIQSCSKDQDEEHDQQRIDEQRSESSLAELDPCGHPVGTALPFLCEHERHSAGDYALESDRNKHRYGE